MIYHSSFQDVCYWFTKETVAFILSRCNIVRSIIKVKGRYLVFLKFHYYDSFFNPTAITSESSMS
jgi:hypothetical protein